MLGFIAISTNNGWEYALVGITIVFSGLVILATVISQLHKLLGLWDNRTALFQKMKAGRKKPPLSEETGTKPPHAPNTLAEAKRHYELLVARIGEPFPLPKLLRLAEARGLHRPHATLNDLIQAGVICPDETGYYIWKA